MATFCCAPSLSHAAIPKRGYDLQTRFLYSEKASNE